jgi:lysylphosphatidylglycerol synthetase-like protein (DUF2156 family)
MKVIRSVVFLSAWLCISVLFLGYFVCTGETPFAVIWGFMAGFAVFDLIRAVRIHGGKYKAIQLASCANTAIVVVGAVLTYEYYGQGKHLTMLYWLALAVLNVWLVYRQRKTFKEAVELDTKLAAFFAEHFPEGQDEDIKLERK